MTTKQTKPKAWRGVYCSRHGEWAARKDDGFMPNCTVIPDGAPLPLDAATRRLVSAALVWSNADITDGMPHGRLMDACAKYRKAKAGKGSK